MCNYTCIHTHTYIYGVHKLEWRARPSTYTIISWCLQRHIQSRCINLSSCICSIMTAHGYIQARRLRRAPEVVMQDVYFNAEPNNCGCFFRRWHRQTVAFYCADVLQDGTSSDKPQNLSSRARKEIRPKHHPWTDATVSATPLSEE